jgi:hypothetical protein
MSSFQEDHLPANLIFSFKINSLKFLLRLESLLSIELMALWGANLRFRISVT